MSDKSMGCLIMAVIAFLLIVVPVGCWVHPNYTVWQQQKEGEAELAKATANRQIKIQEAKAFEESAKSLAEAEVIRAEGVAKANKIIGQSLQNNEGYLRYLWIHELGESKNQVIYIPTEAGLPVLEAGKRDVAK
jgi:hypothetical protein